MKLKGVTEEGKAPSTQDCGLWVPTVSDTIWQMDQSTPGLSPAQSWGSHDRWISANPTERGRTFGCISTHASLSLPFKHISMSFPVFLALLVTIITRHKKCMTNVVSFSLNISLNLPFSGEPDDVSARRNCVRMKRIRHPFRLTSHSERNQGNFQLSSRYRSALRSPSAESDLVLPAKMSCCQILPRALKAMLNSHPSGSGDKKKYGAHALLWAHGVMLQLLQLRWHLLSYPWTKPKHPYFFRNPPLSCTVHWIGAEETWRVANVMLAKRTKWRHMTAECFLVSNYHFCINRGRKNASVDAMNNCGIFPKD